jgi:hypothetical protein
VPAEPLTRRHLQNLALLGGSLLITLVFLEIAARVAESGRGGGKEEQTPAEYTEYDPHLGWRKRAGARATFHRREYSVDVVVNSLGLRGPERGYQTRSDTTRILTLGDSFVEGQGVTAEETATHVLETLLTTPRCPVEAINGGTIGYSTDQEYLFYKHEGVKYGPRLVVLFFYYNDLVANIDATNHGRPKPLLVMKHGSVSEPDEPPAYFQPKKVKAPPEEPSSARSALVDWIASRLRRGAPRAYNTLARFGLWQPIPVVSAPSELIVFQTRPRRTVDFAWRMSRAILRTLKSDVEEQGGHLLVAYVPSRMEVRDADWELTRMLYGVAVGEWDRNAVSRRLAESAREDGVEVLDLTPEMRRAERGLLGGPYFIEDGHWNARGHAVAARAIASYVRDHGWLPSCGAR